MEHNNFLDFNPHQLNHRKKRNFQDYSASHLPFNRERQIAFQPSKQLLSYKSRGYISSRTPPQALNGYSKDPGKKFASSLFSNFSKSKLKRIEVHPSNTTKSRTRKMNGWGRKVSESQDINKEDEEDEYQAKVTNFYQQISESNLSPSSSTITSSSTTTDQEEMKKKRRSFTYSSRDQENSYLYPFPPLSSSLLSSTVLVSSIKGEVKRRGEEIDERMLLKPKFKALTEDEEEAYLSLTSFPSHYGSIRSRYPGEDDSLGSGGGVLEEGKEVIVTKFEIPLKRMHFWRLEPSSWLNDEVFLCELYFIDIKM